MKKYLIIIMFLLLLTGCDVTYNITIDNNIEELTNFYFEESDYNFQDSDYNFDTYYDDYGDDNLSSYSNINEFVDSIFNKDYLAFDGNYNNKELYNVQRINDGISLNYSYKYDNFDKSSILNYCGDIVEYQTSNDIVSISVNDFFNCFMSEYGPALDDLTINIKTDLKVLDNNADEVNGNIYTWNINVNSIVNKKLNLIIRNKKLSANKKNANINIVYWIVFIIFIFVLLIVFLVFYILKKRKENNKF